MQSELLIAVLAGLGGMFGWGLADFFAKKTIDQIGDIASLAWGHVFGTIVLLFAVLYQLFIHGGDVSLPHGFQTWLLLIFFGVLQAAVYLLVYKGFGKGQLAILSPVFASFSGLTAFFSIIVFGEIVTGHLILGLFTLFIGVLLISVDVGALKSRRLGFTQIPGFKEVAIATLLATVWTLSWDKFVGGNDWLSYALFMYAFMTCTILIVAKLQKTDISVAKINRSVWVFLILIGVCQTVAYLAISLGYSSTSFTSIIALLSGAFALPTIILSRLFLREKITTIQTVGTLVVIAGVMWLAVV